MDNIILMFEIYQAKYCCTVFQKSKDLQVLNTFTTGPPLK